GLVLPGFNFLTMTTNTDDVGDGLDNDADALVDEAVGHGTFIAGLIHLIAPEARILPVVVLDSDGFGEVFDIALGIYYAIDHGVEVINLSLGSSGESSAVHDAVSEARRLGIVVVSAAGNDNRREPVRHPASSGDNIGVAATDENDIRASFSNYSSNLFLSAPGTSVTFGGGQFDPNHSILSTIPGGEFAVWEGTSMSTAFVSGAAALIRAQHPEWQSQSDTVQSIEILLASTAINIDLLNPGFVGELGFGRLDIGAAVALGPPQPKIADLDGDGDVDLADLAQILVDFGAVHSSADINADGQVGLTDLAILLLHFGA
ncbi:MAG: S8 family serine peptidase, partial [Dehalococcoidia bacterium]